MEISYKVYSPYLTYYIHLSYYIKEFYSIQMFRNVINNSHDAESCNDRRVLRQDSSPDGINTDMLLDCPAEKKRKRKTEYAILGVISNLR